MKWNGFKTQNSAGKRTQANATAINNALIHGSACASHGNPDVCGDLVELCKLLTKSDKSEAISILFCQHAKTLPSQTTVEIVWQKLLFKRLPIKEHNLNVRNIRNTLSHQTRK